MIFELDNVELSFGNGLLLSGIYLKCERGRVTGILGSNGTGKSSLLKIFFGSLQPQQYLLRIDQKPFLNPLFTSGIVKYLPQKNLLPGNLKIHDAFNFYQVKWEDFSSSFPGFARYQRYQVNELSGGEKRIVELFLTLKCKSQLVLLDEPFSHVAPIHLEQIMDLIQKEKRKKAILLTDHLYRQVLEITDDLYLLKNGCTKLVSDLQDLENYQYLSPNTL